MTVADPYNLERFVQAQANVYANVVAELRNGRKQSHWIWFIFPQAAGLGSSDMSRRYAIASHDEARAYFEHPVLGPRLLECSRLIKTATEPPESILGDLDALKFRSCMALFAEATGEEVFSK